MGNIFTKRTAILIGLTVFATGYLMKSARNATKDGKVKPEDTIAGKLGLI